MRYFKGLVFASEPRVEFHLSRVSWAPLWSRGHLGPLRGPYPPTPHPSGLPGAGGRGVGTGTEQSSGWRRSSSIPTLWPLAHCQAGPVGRKPGSTLGHSQRIGRDHPPGGTRKDKAEGGRGARGGGPAGWGGDGEEVPLPGHSDSPSGDSISVLKSSL